MIKILVDSASDIMYNDPMIDYFLPITLNVDGKEYKGGIDFDSDEFYRMQASAQEFPKTSQPSPQDFLEVFEEVKASGDQLICILLSSGLSGTYQGALIAKDMADYDDIYIIDSRNATHMIAILVGYAARLRDEGYSAAEIVEKCEAVKPRIKVIAGIDTLEYLYKGGRMSRATATVGTIANIKPVITVTPEGTLEVVAKAIGKGRAIQTVIDKFTANDIDRSFPLYSAYSSGTENCEALEEKLKSVGIVPDRRVQVGSTIGAHTGPGVFALMFVTK